MSRDRRGEVGRGTGIEKRQREVGRNAHGEGQGGSTLAK